MVIEADILKQLLSIQNAVFVLSDPNSAFEYLACLLTDLPGIKKSGFVESTSGDVPASSECEVYFPVFYESISYGYYILELSDPVVFSTYSDCLGHFFISICHFIGSRNEFNKLIEEKTSELMKKNKYLENSVAESQESQSQVVMQDKLGSLRQLIAGIAHEINNPLGAIESSRDVLSGCLMRILDSLSDIAAWLSGEHGDLFALLIESAKAGHNSGMDMSTRDKRRFRDNYIELFKLHGIADYQLLSRKMVELCVYEDIERYMPLLKDKDIVTKIDGISDILDAFMASETIKVAVAKTAKIIKALNSYIQNDTDFVTGAGLKVNIDIGESLENVLFIFQNSIKNCIQLEFEVEDGLPLVYGVADELNQVWTNVLQNAIQAMGGKGKLSIIVRKSQGGVVVNISDEGCGMSQEVKSKIFDPMFTTRPPGEGVGLGMNIVQKVVQKHFGRINIESQEGKGTTVSIYLPVEQ